MAWNERDASGIYFVCFRFGKKRFKRSLKTDNKDEADDLTRSLERTLRDVQRGRLALPDDADVVTFLLSDGRVASSPVVEQLSLKGLFAAYFAGLPTGSLEQTTIKGMELHRDHLVRYFHPSFTAQSLSHQDLQGYVASRSVSGATIKKEVVTLRTVWNWAVRAKLLKGVFPGKGLKYPKSTEKPPFMSLAEVEERNDESLWECVYLTVEEISELLGHVQHAEHSFIYPMFVFAAHTGARRSEILRARIEDVDVKNGWVTIRERKRAHDQKTTRRVPMSAVLQHVLKEWLARHPGGNALFCHASEVTRSKKRSRTTGHAGHDRPTTLDARLATVRPREARRIEPLTADEMRDHFKRSLANSRWSKIHGWHVFRHSFISALAAKGIDQRIIDEFSGHQTEEQRRRYRHLLPTKTKEAISSVFG